MNIISTIDPVPGLVNAISDEHWYYNQDTFASRYNYYDQRNRSQPVILGEYAAIYPGSGGPPQVGAQTWGMACAEAITLLGIERNSDIVIGSSYGALIKEYNEEPGSVAVMKHTANEVLKSTSYYVQKLFASFTGMETLPVTAVDGSVGPLYWSAVKSKTKTILKLVNYYGSSGRDSAVTVKIDGSKASSAHLVRLSAPNETAVNNLPGLGGEATTLVQSRITGRNGRFSIDFEFDTEIVVLIV